MEDVNYVIIIGRLTRDAELKYTNSGLAVSSFSLAVNRRKRSGDNWEDEVSFFDLALFGKRAESLNQYLTKGQQVAVEGSLTQDRWEQDGQKRSKVKIIANNIQLLGGRGQGGGMQGSAQGGGYQQGGMNQNQGGGYGGAPQGGFNNQPQGGGERFQPDNNYSADFEDDIPF
ncbi:MAG: single-stranded DNA-binding protein [Spirochaetales bacterium]|uniref:Single-stranded DNA-binding protein n=1 Tax=Candidatus Thalassospirochaeta sargassi TaxID=3119039 RepID=A0AAJ1IAD5_9SPIO|nr:single-stranded DNA-binding protein [Spirochaetales bacterium]